MVCDCVIVSFPDLFLIKFLNNAFVTVFYFIKRIYILGPYTLLNGVESA